MDATVRSYVTMIRAVRNAAQRARVLAYLEGRLDQPLALFLRSLFAVHDIEDMARLDLALWTFPATAGIDNFLSSRDGSATAFEYGPGASTFWLSRRCREVFVVEHDPKWWSLIAPMMVTNTRGELVPPRRLASGVSPLCGSRRTGWRNLEFKEYVAAIRRADGPFDLIIIDGRARPSCLLEAKRHLKKDGVIVFDDSSRYRYRGALKQSGLVGRRYRGFTSTHPYRSETVLLARNESVLANLPA